MPPAARKTDPTIHGGMIVEGSPNVTIGFLPAARAGDMAICVGPPDAISQGESSVLIGGKPAARLGDPMQHGGLLVAGCPTVLIGSSAQGVTLSHAALEGSAFCEECEKAKKKEGA